MSEKKINGADARMFKGNRPLFSKRFIVSDKSKPLAQLCAHLARIVAEDANTAFYVQEYGYKGNVNARPDYIDYLANRLEFEIRNSTGANLK